MAELRTETMTVNMGPQHPSTHGVLRLILELLARPSSRPDDHRLPASVIERRRRKVHRWFRSWSGCIPRRASNSLGYALTLKSCWAGDADGLEAILVLIAELSGCGLSSIGRMRETCRRDLFYAIRSAIFYNITS